MEKKLPSGKPIINARSETISTKPSFRNFFRHKRCLVSANEGKNWLASAG
ncbi:MAG: SOS response-associated peptidase family protein [Sphingomonadales bacterium]